MTKKIVECKYSIGIQVEKYVKVLFSYASTYSSFSFLDQDEHVHQIQWVTVEYIYEIEF